MDYHGSAGAAIAAATANNSHDEPFLRRRLERETPTLSKDRWVQAHSMAHDMRQKRHSFLEAR